MDAIETLHCTQCNGELHPDEGQIFLTCPYCSSTVYIDKSQTVFHWYLAPTLDEEKAQASLRRWMSGSQTVKDLDKKARLVSESFEYFPVWYFKRLRPGGKEEVVLQPAAATSVTELKHLKLLAGDLRKYNSNLDSQARAPTVPLQTALAWSGVEAGPTGEIGEMALVHLPLYMFKYQYQNQQYTALVEAGTGSVVANVFPAKAESPYQFIAGLTAFVFFFLAVLPLAGALINSFSGATVGFQICTGLGLIAAPVLFGLAAWVAAKV